MERIPEAKRETGTYCTCADKGVIIESFALKYGKSNGVCGPGHFTPSTVVSKSMVCSICHRAYAFESLLTGNPELEKELRFELSLGIGELKRPITKEDLPLIGYVKQKKMKDVVLRGITYPQHSMHQATKKPTSVPAELKKLKVGTTVFFTPSEQGEAYANPHNTFGTIQLSAERSAKTFKVSYDCFK